MMKKSNLLQQVVNAFEEQEGKGYIAEKEVIRIKAQLYTLLGEYNNLISQINDQESELRLVLQVKGSFISPELDSVKVGTFSPSTFSLATLLDSAYKNRADLLDRQNDCRGQQTQLQLSEGAGRS